MHQMNLPSVGGTGMLSPQTTYGRPGVPCRGWRAGNPLEKHVSALDDQGLVMTQQFQERQAIIRGANRPSIWAMAAPG